MSWFIDWRNAKTESENLELLKEKIKRYNALLNAQGWPEDIERNLKKIIKELETEINSYDKKAA